MATATVHKIYRVCQHCGGDGYLESVTQAPGQDPVTTQQVCPNCNGHTVFLFGYMAEDTYELTVP